MKAESLHYEQYLVTDSDSSYSSTILKDSHV